MWFWFGASQNSWGAIALASRTRGAGSKDIETLIEATNILIAQSNILLNSISGFLNPVDVSDRDARLLGRVYGNLDQLQQRPASFDLYSALRYVGVEIDPRAIRALTVADFVSANLVSPTTVISGQVTLTGTPAINPLAALSTPCKSVTVESVNTNTVVYVGNAAVTTLNGYNLQPGATASLDIDDLNKVNVTGTAGNVVSYLAVN